MKILITGGSGFIGRNLVKALKQEHEVYSPQVQN
jgi:nucleoside-diphosphate-sugar epimerase